MRQMKEKKTGKPVRAGRTRQVKWLAGCGVAALAAAAAAGAGLLKNPDRAASDRLYQERQVTDGSIVIVGIDERALQDIGPFQTWGRDVTAMALEYLNADENSRPAVIGLDILFAGGTDPEMDEWLAQAAGAYRNVVAASAASFDSSLVTEKDGSFRMDSFTVTDFDEPYALLNQSAHRGHINAMLDTDGILRRHLLYVDRPDGGREPSFSLTVANLYRESLGEDPVAEPGTDGNGFWYLPYTGMPGDYYEDISVADLLEQTVPSDYFAGKIVLIGPYAAGLKDSYPTSIDHAGPMYGVEYQANVIQALLDENYKREVGEGLQLAVLFLILFLSGLWFIRSSLLASAIGWAVCAGGWLALCRFLYYEKGLVLHVLWVPAFVTVLFVLSIALYYVREAMEKHRVTATFKRYVAPEIVTELLKEGPEALELGGKLCDIAVLFVDIRGFTTMSEHLKPPEVVEILNRYLNLTSSCIMRNKGTLDKFVGDATMAFWGAPLPQKDPVMQAAKAALDMVEGSKALSEELLETYGRTVSFGIGIHVGPAVVGNIGAENRMDYTAIGDTVNTSARLESNAPGGKIYISRAVADALEGRVRVTSLGNAIKLKGKAEGFEILTLDGLMEKEAGQTG